MTAQELIENLKSSGNMYDLGYKSDAIWLYIKNANTAQRAVNTLMNNENIFYMWAIRDLSVHRLYVLTDMCRLIVVQHTRLSDDVEVYNLLDWWNKDAEDFVRKEFEERHTKPGIPDVNSRTSIQIGDWGCMLPYGEFEAKFFKDKLIRVYNLPQKIYDVFVDCVKKYYINHKTIKNEQSVDNNIAENLIKYKSLLDSGIITQDEFNTLKGKLINR